MAGLLDDIIQKLNRDTSVKVNFDLPNFNQTYEQQQRAPDLNNGRYQQRPSEPIPPQTQQLYTQSVVQQHYPYVQQGNLLSKSVTSLGQGQQQVLPSQATLLTQILPLSQTTIKQDVQNLQAKLQTAPLQEQQEAEHLLQQLLSQLQFYIQQQMQYQGQMNTHPNSTFYMNPQLCDQAVFQNANQWPQQRISDNPLLRQPKEVIRQHLPFLCQEIFDDINITFSGIIATKVARITLDKQQRFFWIQAIDQQFKLLWSSQQNEPAVGSLTLRDHIKHILLGQPAEDYIKCRLDTKQLGSVHSVDYAKVNKQHLKLYLSLVCDKRDVNIIFENVDDLELWAAAVIEFSGCKSIYCE